MIRVGFGIDVHKFVENRDLWIGGVKIPYEYGLAGHSDADVLIHAICDALLGAANLRDIGYQFPDNSDEFLNIDSKILLRRTGELLKEKGYSIGNIDSTVAAQAPKLNPHIPAMQQTMGLPTMKTMALSTLTGYCQCANARVAATGAEAEELTEIDAYLNSGFYIE